MIRLERVTKLYRTPGAPDVFAVRDVELAIGRGETLCLIGASGCGKTTTLRLINRLAEPTSGRVVVDGVDVATVDPVRLRRGIGYVIQDGGLFPHLTVAANVGLLCELEGWDAQRTAARTDELLALVQLGREHRDRYPSELSGGQRQRVGVARALALDPSVLLLDEPFGALDPITRRELQDEFRSLLRAVSKTAVIVTHDLNEAFRLGDRIALMSGGRIVQVGTKDELVRSPADDFVRRFVAGAADAG